MTSPWAEAATLQVQGCPEPQVGSEAGVSLWSWVQPPGAGRTGSGLSRWLSFCFLVAPQTPTSESPPGPVVLRPGSLKLGSWVWWEIWGHLGVMGFVLPLTHLQGGK